MTDPCGATTLSIDSLIFSSLSISYNIGYTAHVETLDVTLGNHITEYPSVTGFGCPSLELSFEDYNTGLPIDATIFTYTLATNEF